MPRGCGPTVAHVSLCECLLQCPQNGAQPFPCFWVRGNGGKHKKKITTTLSLCSNTNLPMALFLHRSITNTPYYSSILVLSKSLGDDGDSNAIMYYCYYSQPTDISLGSNSSLDNIMQYKKIYIYQIYVTKTNHKTNYLGLSHFFVA